MRSEFPAAAITAQQGGTLPRRFFNNPDKKESPDTF